MHRFFINPTQITGQTVTLLDDQARQIVGVLRLRVGERIGVLDNGGGLYEVVLTAVNRHRVTGEIVGKTAVATEPTTHITLYQSILKRDKFEWVLQKGTEIGISRFVPVVTERSLAQHVKDNKYDRWQRILTEAAEQAERGIIPELAEACSFAEALTMAQTADLALIAWAREKEARLSSYLSPLKQQPTPHVALFTGPEGGFSPAEITQAQQANVRPTTLGPRILRTETAAMVAAAFVLYEMEMRDWEIGRSRD